MKKVFSLLSLVALFGLSTPLAYAGLSESCFPAVQCNTGQDYYSTTCQSHIESLTGVSPSCQSVNGAPAAGNQWAFSCGSGCYQSSIPIPPACPGGVMVGGSCLAKLDVLKDNVPVTGEKAYKIYDGSTLTEIVHLDTAGCTDGQVPVSDTASSTGWKCGAGGGLWIANGSDIYYNAGHVGIGVSTPGAPLDVEMVNGPAATIGSNTNSATGDFSVAIGDATSASNHASLATGTNTIADGYSATSMGFYTTASGPYSLAAGGLTTASGIGSAAIGDHATATGDYSIAMGYYSVANAIRSTAMGANTIASGLNATAMGSSTTASGNSSTAMGSSTTASGFNATAMGSSTTAQASNSVVIGQYNVISGTTNSWVATDPLFVIGNGSSLASPANALTVFKNASVAIGNRSTAQAFNSVVIGQYNVISGTTSSWVATDPLFVIGNGASAASPANALTVLKNGKVGIGTATPGVALDVEMASGGAATIGSTLNAATGDYAIAMGYGTTASGFFSTAMGYGSTASGTNSLATGYSTWANGSSSVAMGEGSQATAIYSIAMGHGSKATANDSIAMGPNTTASGIAAVAMGSLTTASGPSSFSMGSNSLASGNYASAMGYYPTAAGDFSLAVGDHPNASGFNSTALGKYTTSTGYYSTAIGYYSTAQAYDSVAIGRYNVIAGTTNSWISTDPLFVIGNGSSGLAPSNALTLLKNGDLTIAGTASKPGGGSWSVASDARLKDIKGDYQKGLSSILALKPVQFRYKMDNPKHLPSDQDYVGFIAQEVQKIFPEAVSEDSQGYLDFDMHPVNVAVINAIRELKTENDALREALCGLKPDAEICQTK